MGWVRIETSRRRGKEGFHNQQCWEETQNKGIGVDQAADWPKIWVRRRKSKWVSGKCWIGTDQGSAPSSVSSPLPGISTIPTLAHLPPTPFDIAVIHQNDNDAQILPPTINWTNCETFKSVNYYGRGFGSFGGTAIDMCNVHFVWYQGFANTGHPHLSCSLQ